VPQAVQMKTESGAWGRAVARLAWVTTFLLVTGGCTALLRHRQTAGAALEEPAAQRISAAELSAYIRFLADDLLEGRGPGTRGDRLARAYIATTMQALGAQPGAPDGGWQQPFALLGVMTQAPPTWSFRQPSGGLDLEDRRDFVAMSGADAESVAVENAEVVFVGYGIQAPEYTWDDFKQHDLRGKVLVMLNSDPDWDPQLFGGKRRLYYGRWTYKYESAARQGAAGAIIIHTPDSAGYPWQTVVSSWTGENSRLADGRPTGPRIEAWITEEAARRMFALAGHNLDEAVAGARSRDFIPVPLGLTTSLRLRNQVRRYESANVVGALPGRDAQLREQAVIYSAHHDHLGAQAGPDGLPVIYNGAVDNATGVAQLLSVAGAFAALPQPPRRSIVFLAVAAEEQGLLGSEYFVRHPTVPLDRIAADLNFDGGNIWGRTRDVAALGYGKSTLDEIVREAAAQQGRTYSDDPFPERGLFYRSDQFSFARSGVPALLVRSGTDFIGRPKDWGRMQVDAWLEKHYHQPSDDFDPGWDLSGMVDDARLAFAVGLALANGDGMPTWNPTDEFAAVRRIPSPQ
jgi:Zn-dependent M28 family amino/carboxypeptidase